MNQKNLYCRRVLRLYNKALSTRSRKLKSKYFMILHQELWNELTETPGMIKRDSLVNCIMKFSKFYNLFENNHRCFLCVGADAFASVARAPGRGGACELCPLAINNIGGIPCGFNDGYNPYDMWTSWIEDYDGFFVNKDHCKRYTMEILTIFGKY